MTEQAKDPRMDWGFYAMTPRIVRTKYKDLSHTEKWLYTCLKDLCGKRGVCFRSLRSLKEETDISIASLSTMIPRLHAAGLIHAEKKRRSASGKEIWHISIVDIWQLNKDYCSEIEQSNSEDVQDLNKDSEIVQSVNKVVQNTNKVAGDCSIPERDCSNFSDRRRDSKNKDTEIYNEEEGTYHAGESENAAAPVSAIASTAPAQSSSRFVFQIQGAKRFYYHDFCIHEQDRGINDGLTLLVKQLSDVPQDAECSICYKPVHGPHGYYEICEEPYQPNFNAQNESDNHSHIANDTPQGDTNGHTANAFADLRDTRTDTHRDGRTHGEHLQRAEHGDRRTTPDQQQSTQAVTSQSSSTSGGYEKVEQADSQAQLSTLTGSSPQASAKVEPRASRSRTLGKRASEYKIYFTIEGSSFRGWYEEIFGIQLDETAANARACNALGKRESVTYDNIKLVAKEIDVNKWVKDNNVAVTVQDLANDNSNLRWEKWLQSAQKRAKRAVPPPAPTIEENPYSFAAQLARNPLPTLKGATV